ncbi:hypothetical protein FZC76_03920 [Sutcliffiella horikoshii]|uniref:Uncharacterized protein n=1 Tax=Sutcliffiella horikoshii TaxID=79883 RepID=A0A5D4T6Z1_9BACI|nr:hypothetical protein [Sutcliffiella horikoshii]TYS71049.1 hypothetical protein FZC76_03920 [Sutcliffiella horikoshii]
MFETLIYQEIKSILALIEDAEETILQIKGILNYEKIIRYEWIYEREWFIKKVVRNLSEEDYPLT